MGSVEFYNRQLTIFSHIITYGNAVDAALTEMIRDEIETLWNEPQAFLHFDDQVVRVAFSITAHYCPDTTPLDIYQNLDPRNNFFRIEEFSRNNISFVDGVGCNTGYFKLENLYKGSTTAAHEYGHTLGLDHPHHLDVRGEGRPGIMYPRGTLVDAIYQYNPDGACGDTSNGGTMHPCHRQVRQQDIEQLKLHRLEFEHGKAIIGEFTSLWHEDHRLLSSDDPL